MLKRFCYYSIRNTTWKQRDKQLTLLKDLSSSVLVNKYFSSYICDPQNCWNCGFVILSLNKLNLMNVKKPLYDFIHNFIYLNT